MRGQRFGALPNSIACDPEQYSTQWDYMDCLLDQKMFIMRTPMYFSYRLTVCENV